MVSLTMVVTSRMLPKNAMDLCIMVIRPPLVGAYYIYMSSKSGRAWSHLSMVRLLGGS